VLLPSLLFTSILDAVYLARINPSRANVASVVFPFAWGLLTPVCGLVIGYISVKLMAKEKSQPVQRAAMMTIAFGNAGNLPLLLLSALCESYGPLSRITPNCIPQSASLTSLFSIPWNILFWQPFFSFLIAAKAPDSSEVIGQFSPLIRKSTPAKDMPMPDKPPLFSPPFISIIAAFVTAFTPFLPQALLHTDGFLSALTSSLRQLGNMVVPMSSLIVGAKLYVAQMNSRSNVRDTVTGRGEGDLVGEVVVRIGGDGEVNELQRWQYTQNRFGRRLHVMIFTLRLICMPILGRMMYAILGVWRLESKLLGMFSLMEWMVPTANSSVMAIILASQYWPEIGRQIEDDVASTLLYQTMAVPVLLTINTALALGVVFN